jgi:cytochrome c-type biogenesis protein CcsB
VNPINETLARVSNDLMLWTVVAYSVAMLGFAVEFAAGRRGRAPARWVEGAGLAAIGVTALGWGLHVGAAVTRGLAVHRAPWGNMYEFAMMASLVAVTLFLVGIRRWHLRPLGAFVLAPLILYLGLAGTVLYTQAGNLVPALHDYWIWIHVAAGITATGSFILSGVVTVLYLLKERWERGEPPLRHVAVQRWRRPAPASMGPGTPAVAEFREARRAAGAATADGGEPDDDPEARRWPSRLMESLPGADHLERTSYRIIVFAFPVWTFAIIAGAIWAHAAWSRFWGWDPKETWSFITWLAYAAYLHARATGGWRGRRAAVISLIGFGCLIVNFYVVNTVVVGLHSYAFGGGGGTT